MWRIVHSPAGIRCGLGASVWSEVPTNLIKQRITEPAVGNVQPRCPLPGRFAFAARVVSCFLDLFKTYQTQRSLMLEPKGKGTFVCLPQSPNFVIVSSVFLTIS